MHQVVVMRYEVKVGEKTFEVEVEEVEPQVFEVSVNGKKARLKIGEYSESKPVKAVSGNEVKADMSGTVVKLLVDKGEAVEEGQPLLVMEAMKMENEVVSPFSGIVEEILVKEGDKVSSGDVLVVISGSSEAEAKGTPVSVAMSGIVTKILKNPGERVKAGEPIAILEAMKMENPVNSPSDGVISSVLVKEGDKVSPGDVIAYVDTGNV